MINKITSIRIGFVDVDIIQNVSFLNAYIHERDLEKISVESIGARIWAFFNRGPLGYGNKRWTYPIPSVYCASLCNITSTRIPLTLHIYMPLQRINVSTLLGCVMRTNKWNQMLNVIRTTTHKYKLTTCIGIVYIHKLYLRQVRQTRLVYPNLNPD